MISKPKGTLDILPEDAFKRQHIENRLRESASLYNYKEIRTPTFEKTELFKRGIGEDTDIVSKEMYSFSNNEFTLKPEMTAPVIRAYIENSLYNVSPVVKLFYISNMYRHERPQAGRYREFSQFGAEVIGSSDFTSDVELISLGVFSLKNFGLNDLKIKVNNIGNIEERTEYINELREYLNKFESDLSNESKRRLITNPLRILDSKDPKDISIIEDAPTINNFLGIENLKHFENVMNGLESLSIKFEVDYKLVRGLDYYTSTTFEIASDSLGAQNAVMGGGRYDKLIEQLGGKPTPAIGFACGLERLTLILQSNNYQFPKEDSPQLYLVTSGEDARKLAMVISNKLRERGVQCETDLLNRSIKSQMKEANKINSKYVAVIGEDEISTGEVKIKRMLDGSESGINLDEITNYNFN
ncbi:MAG: histidine--tRNA ligase [Candidatus Kapaibacterium sp.]